MDQTKRRFFKNKLEYGKKNYGSLLGITRIDKITQMDYNFFGVASIGLEFGITVGHIEKNGTN